jgi:nicotinamide/nicotinate riboside kinase
MLHQAVVSWLSMAKLPKSVNSVTICILDGFLLYSDPARRSIPRSITDLLDLKLFVRSNYERTKTRREARKGYVTLEGFWEDPEGYVDEVVWPNYIAEHKWMFEGRDVDDGEVAERVQEEGILVAPGKGEMSIGELLLWSVETIEREIVRILGESEA